MSAPVIPAVLPDPPQDRPLPPEYWPSIDHLVTEDASPMDNIYSEKQQRLLTRPLYSSWVPEESFVVLANVGMFYALREPPVVPDVLLSLGVHFPEELNEKRHRSYFFWEFGKAPETVIEVVSNQEGEELAGKWKLLARIGILYYVVWDPFKYLKPEKLHVFMLQGKKYFPLEKPWFPEVGLGLTIWNGNFEGVETDWLRWCDQKGQIIPTGQERADQEKQRADQEKQRADLEKQRGDLEKQRADQEKQRAERLVAQLRSLGVDPQNGMS